MAKKLRNKTNIILLAFVAVLALVFILQYINPTESLGSDQTQKQTPQEVREVLLLEALEKNITITPSEFKSAYLGLVNKSGMSEEAYLEYVIKERKSKENYDKFLEDNLKVLKLINDQIDWSRIKIENSAIDAYIAQNPEIFPANQMADPVFKEQLYSVARKQMFEKQRQQLIEEYVQGIVAKYGN